jgi:hypothetical protein
MRHTSEFSPHRSTAHERRTRNPGLCRGLHLIGMSARLLRLWRLRTLRRFSSPRSRRRDTADGSGTACRSLCLADQRFACRLRDTTDGSETARRSLCLADQKFACRRDTSDGSETARRSSHLADQRFACRRRDTADGSGTARRSLCLADQKFACRRDTADGSETARRSSCLADQRFARRRRGTTDAAGTARRSLSGRGCATERGSEQDADAADDVAATGERDCLRYPAW